MLIATLLLNLLILSKTDQITQPTLCFLQELFDLQALIHAFQPGILGNVVLAKLTKAYKEHTGTTFP